MKPNFIYLPQERDFSPAFIRHNRNVQTSFHHVLPYHLFRDFYNQAMSYLSGEMPCTDHVWEQLSSQMRFLMIASGANHDDISAGFHFLKGLKSNSAINPGIDFGAIFDRICPFVSWPGFNLVEGPTARSDDPKGGFDDFRLTPGISERRRNIIKMLHEVYNILAPLKFSTIPAETLSLCFTKIINTLNKSYALPPVPFTHKSWVLGRDDQYAKSSTSLVSCARLLFHMQARASLDQSPKEERLFLDSEHFKALAVKLTC